MEKTCEKIAEMLVDYADGQLLPSDSKKVAHHLAECAHCRKMLDALQRSLELAEVVWDDGLAEINKIRAPIPGKAPKIRWPRYAAVAAGILLVITTSFLWRALVRPAKKELTFAEIERKITESASAARLLAAAELLADYSNNEAIVKEQFRYIVETYPETAAAAKAKSKIQ
ncbi:MAG TPA: zf-HC2 domain-containing protein [Sedimentisphaerales bacterium]|nr:zf-HC2 domain-containing protein [Sedimentisphaerales bacterium]